MAQDGGTIDKNYDLRKIAALAKARKLGEALRRGDGPVRASECSKCGGKDGSHYPWCGSSQN